ncbi:secreted RxLR effector protein 161-like [Ziziphus jujuba]|uniref:Secreted RxLR effector protein 161-like n=1 Tax=Ziziphus jujuba TaxID=326968 RepID=A0ABM4AGC3_ZIZJJ|nr:secreted RxLR effector protein 161-like [Ziziphus jujuba]
MSDLRVMNYFLGMEIYQFSHGIFLSQKKYAVELLKKFDMEKRNLVDTPMVYNQKFELENGAAKIEVSTYRSLIGSLFYLCASRPDIIFSVSLLSRFMHASSHMHYSAVKRVLRYIRGTVDYGVWFLKQEEGKLMGYVDSDWAGSMQDSKSTSGYLFSLGSGPFSWSLQKQGSVAQSTAEAEYITAAASSNQV